MCLLARPLSETQSIQPTNIYLTTLLHTSVSLNQQLFSMAEEKHHFGFLHKSHANDEIEGEVKEKKHHKHIGKAAALGAAAIGAYALHEKKAAKKAEDPEDSRKHRVKEEVAAVAALGAAGVALHQHHKKKAEEKQ